MKCDILRAPRAEDAGVFSTGVEHKPKKDEGEALTRGGVEQRDWLVLQREKKKKDRKNWPGPPSPVPYKAVFLSSEHIEAGTAAACLRATQLHSGDGEQDTLG